MTGAEREELLADEWLIVRNSGEIPEITYHSSLYYLEKDPSGPGLELSEVEKTELKDAAIQRHHEIILRDILLENYHKTIYRGVKRTIYNWHRCKAFSERQGFSCDGFRKTAADALILFLEQGSKAAGESLPENFLNCHIDRLLEFAEELEIERKQLPPDLEIFCLPK